MVSKVAVVALVAILAVPILMGYAMNLSEGTVTEYELNKDPVNVTGLLQNDMVYTTAKADIYKMNTEFSYVSGNNTYPMMPRYDKVISSSSSLPWWNGNITSWGGGTQPLSTDILKYAIMMFYDRSNGSVDVDFYNGPNVIWHVNAAQYIYYDRSTDSITIHYFVTQNQLNTTVISCDGYTAIHFTMNNGLVTCPVEYSIQYANSITFADISAGFHFQEISEDLRINFPQKCDSVLFTINLDSIPESNYKIQIGAQYGGYMTFEKVTNASGVKYYFNSGEIYHDPKRNDNTYQILYSMQYEYTTGNMSIYNMHTEARYVGSWHSFIGPAHYYMKYEYNTPLTAYNDSNHDLALNYLKYHLQNSYSYKGRSFTMRMDEANYSAFQVPAITNNTFDPAAFRSNPSTKITDIQLYGESIVFGGNTYNVGSDGNITIGQRQFSIEKIIFESLPIAGGYENRINGNVISVTADPSTISLLGNWRASVTVDGNVATTTTKTQWTPGEFAWDGLDQNFLMIGLLAALGVFIALGIAYRQVKSALFALVVVCGGALLLFITML